MSDDSPSLAETQAFPPQDAALSPASRRARESSAREREQAHAPAWTQRDDEAPR